MDGNAVFVHAFRKILTRIFFIIQKVTVLTEFNVNCGVEAQYDQRQQGIVQQEQQLASLRNELARVGTDGYVENEARERYDYVREGEVRFVFSAPEKLTYYTEDEWEIIMDEELYPTY